MAARVTFTILAIIAVCHAYRHAAPRQRFRRSQRFAYEAEFERSWARDNIKALGLKLKEFEYLAGGRLRGLSSSSQIQANDAVVSLPLSKCLVAAEKAGDTKGPSAYASVWGDIKGTSRLALLLLDEYQQLEKSAIKDYIEHLPAPCEIATPFHWDDEFLEKLPYKSMIEAVTLQKKGWKRLYDLVTQNKANTVSFERFVWAMEMVQSRAFQGIGGMQTSNVKTLGGVSVALLSVAALISTTHIIQGEIAPAIAASLAVLVSVPAFLQSQSSSCVLLPAIDDANHASRSPNCDISFEPVSDAFVMRANAAIPAGTQIKISYGDRNNDELFQFFGFIEEENYHDVYAISNPQYIVKEVLESGEIEGVVEKDKALLLRNINGACAAPKAQTMAAASQSNIVVNRKDLSSWSMGSLAQFMQIDGSDEGGELTRTVMKKVLQSELSAMENHLSNRSAGESEKEALVAAFIKEKVSVLKQALLKLQ